MGVCAVFLLCGCDAVHPIPSVATTVKQVEVAVFEGGYGIDWHKDTALAYNRSQAGVHIGLWGDPRVVEKVKPRMLRGDPPDLVSVTYLPIWRLVAAGELLTFNDALAVPAPGGHKPWGDLFIPGMLDLYKSGGDVFGVPTAFNLWVCWYNAALFRRHGWKVPRDWDELLALCEQMQAAGVAPLAFQGKYPIYGVWTFFSLIYRIGGTAAINRINALEPGAWTQPEVVQAARLWQGLAVTHFQKGAMAMNHTESQLEWVNGNAGLIFCGLWLYNEMKDSLPPEFEMRCFPVPAVPGGKGNRNIHFGMGSEFMFVPADARYPDEAKAFARHLVSPAQAPEMSRRTGIISPLKNGTPPEAVDKPLRSAIGVIRGADGFFGVRVDWLLLDWQTQVLAPHMGRLLSGEETPEECCRELEAGVQQAIADPRVIVPPVDPYDPAQFGEES